MRVFHHPNAVEVDERTGIGQVVINLQKRLENLGVEYVKKPEDADVIAVHVLKGNFPNIDILHCHGLYFDDVPHIPYDNWHYRVNREIAQTARESLEVIVPSAWVAEPFMRDMRITPSIIPHGVDIDKWKRRENKGYVLWNKNRASDVCDPSYAYYLAMAGIYTVSTFAPAEMKGKPNSLTVIGEAVPHSKMKDYIEHAEIYLATTIETFGIGTLEALASGVPVLGFRWGATPDIITHLKDGYLANPEDINDLINGAQYIHDHFEQMSKAARETAKKYTWEAAAQEYYKVYQDVAERKRNETHRVSVVIPSYNYASYVESAIESVLNQSRKPDEIIVINDGSTDNTAEVLEKYKDNQKIKIVHQKNQGVAASRNNGIRLATSPYIVCLDADDMLADSFIDVLRKAMIKDRSLGIAYSGLSLVHATGEETIQMGWPGEFNWETQSEIHVPPSNTIPSACMFRKSMWERAGGFRQFYAPGEDAEFWTRGLSLGFNAKRVTTEALFRYRVHEGSASRTKKYKTIHTWLPWMRDRDFPFAAPVSVKTNVHVRSYSRPNVSVIIPVCKAHLKLLKSAVSSVVGQTLRQWEILVICDGVDDSEITEIMTMYPFLRIFHTKDKTGAGAARNIGIKNAKAPFVFFLDADDYIAPTALERLVNFHTIYPGRYIYSDWVSIEGEERKVHISEEYSQDAWFKPSPHGKDWLYGINAISVLMRTKQAKEVLFDENLQGWEDWDFFVRCAIKGYCGVRYPEPVFYYRINTGQRRKYTAEQKEGLADALRLKYNKYIERKDKMAGCCGGNVINLSREPTRLDLNSNDVVRMEYIGDNMGAITFNVKGRMYRGGRSPLSRYIDAYKEDVSFLESTGKWRLIASVPVPENEVVDSDESISDEPQEVIIEKRKRGRPRK